VASLPTPPSRDRLGRRLMRVAGWLVGAPLAIFRFLRRDVALVEIDPPGPQDALPAEDHEAAREEAGVGPVIHRLYSATIREPKLTAGRLLDVIAADPNVIAPSEVLRFERTRGEPGPVREGDELLIRMAGPWNAPVTVIRRWDEGIRLAARAGHPQLGQVEVRARDDDDDVVLQIRTRERAAGVGFRALQLFGLIRRMQSYTWAEMIENAAQLAGGPQPEQIAVWSWRDDPRSEVPRSLSRVAAAHTKRRSTYDRDGRADDRSPGSD